MSALQNISENDKQVALGLIKAMVASDPVDRPPAQAIYDHPMFWDAAQVLTFFQVNVASLEESIYLLIICTESYGYF